MEDIMVTCDFSDTCFFFNEESSDKIQIKEILRFEYCESDFTKCARRQMALSQGPDNVQHNLLPDGFIEAEFFLRNVTLKYKKRTGRLSCLH
jgi:hypothetical protein